MQGCFFNDVRRINPFETECAACSTHDMKHPSGEQSERVFVRAIGLRVSLFSARVFVFVLSKEIF